ncbi:hypothetical protein BH20ACT22_BH20ACT22_04720 [soil metagenome]
MGATLIDDAGLLGEGEDAHMEPIVGIISGQGRASPARFLVDKQRVRAFPNRLGFAEVSLELGIDRLDHTRCAFVMKL